MLWVFLGLHRFLLGLAVTAIVQLQGALDEICFSLTLI